MSERHQMAESCLQARPENQNASSGSCRWASQCDRVRHARKIPQNGRAYNLGQQVIETQRAFLARRRIFSWRSKSHVGCREKNDNSHRNSGTSDLVEQERSELSRNLSQSIW